jgi:hypothetical protein
LAERVGARLSRDWLRLLGDAIAIGALVWIFSLSSATESRMTALEKRVDALEFRLSRVVAELPVLRTRIANEAVFSPFGAAVLTLRPVGSGADGTSETIFLVEAATGNVTQFRLSWTDAEPGVAMAVAGSLRTLDPRAISIAEEERLAAHLKQPAAHLQAIDADQSFVLYAPTAEVYEQLRKIGAKKVRESTATPVLNWAQLARVLETSTWLKPAAGAGATE